MGGDAGRLSERAMSASGHRQAFTLCRLPSTCPPTANPPLPPSNPPYGKPSSIPPRVESWRLAVRAKQRLSTNTSCNPSTLHWHLTPSRRYLCAHRCPLPRAKRTSRSLSVMSAPDPKRTLIRVCQGALRGWLLAPTRLVTFVSFDHRQTALLPR